MLSKAIASISKRQHWLWVLGDQGLVSGCNFLAGIILARSMGLEGYGHYVLMNAAMLYLNTYPGALLITPLLALAPQRKADEKSRFLRGSFSLQVALSLLLTLFALLIGLVVAAFTTDWLSPASLVALCAATFVFQLQDWFRRYFILQDQVQRTFISDLIAYGGFVISLISCHLLDSLTVTSALYCLAGSSGLSAMLALVQSRMTISVRDARKLFSETWHPSKNYLFSSQLQWISGQGVILIGAASLGASAAGAIRAVQNIVAPLNVLLQVMENTVPVKAAVVYAEAGERAMLAVLKKYLWHSILVFGGILAFAIGFSRQLIELAYGVSYSSFYYLMYYHGAFFVLILLFRYLSYYFRVVNDAKPIFLASLICAFSSVIASLIFIDEFQERGVMIALLVGQGLATVYIYGRFYLRRVD